MFGSHYALGRGSERIMSRRWPGAGRRRARFIELVDQEPGIGWRIACSRVCVEFGVGMQTALEDENILIDAGYLVEDLEGRLTRGSLK